MIRSGRESPNCPRHLADYDKAITIAPRFTDAMDERGMTLFDLGRYDDAAQQLATVVRVTPGDPYPVLWLHIARLRAHTPDAQEFQAGIKTLDLTTWPAPLFDLYLGKASIDDVRAASEQHPDGAAEGECETAIFGGEYQLTKGDPAAATSLIAEASRACGPSENRYLTAWAELKRLVPAASKQGPW
jgi:lipoprotein NlpI